MLIYESTKHGFLYPVINDRIAEEIIKNTYGTLITRGMNGFYVYCVDDRLIIPGHHRYNDPLGCPDLARSN
ncbi:MAG: DNA/RNA helicase domain-containing protein [Thermoplasmatota archaeon]